MQSKKQLLFQPLMTRARKLAAQAQQNGDVPVGALIVCPKNPALNPVDWRLEEWEIISSGYNRRETPPYDPTAHAEIQAIRAAAQKLGSWRLENCTLVVTLEPCMMCAGAIVNSRIKRVVFGAWDEKGGGCGSVEDLVRHPRLNHQIEVYGGIEEKECAAQLQDFFKQNRWLNR